jgi:inner membrane protein
MPTIVTHAVVPIAIGLGVGRRYVSSPLLACGVLASILPDLDVFAFRFGVSYSNQLGHRGFSHSVLFALLLGLFAAAIARWLCTNRTAAFTFVFVAAFSHGLLDMFTNGGMGVALWWPFSEVRLFAPWQVIEVSPLSLLRVIGSRGLVVLWSEFKWVWLPAAVAACLLVLGVRTRASTGH